MGSRSVIFAGSSDHPGVYSHWNGEPEDMLPVLGSIRYHTLEHQDGLDVEVFRKSYITDVTQGWSVFDSRKASVREGDVPFNDFTLEEAQEQGFDIYIVTAEGVTHMKNEQSPIVHSWEDLVNLLGE